MLLGIAYFPPVSYFALIAEGMVLSREKTVPSTVYVEACETYQKQSWRNRCRYYAADGPQYLNFPIIHEGGTHQIPIRQVRVDYSTPWVAKTERAISSAYESSAYFDYYKDELFSILDSRPETLFELDLEIIRFFIRKIGLSVDIRFTEEYIPHRRPFPPVPEHPRGERWFDGLTNRSCTVHEPVEGVEGPYGQDYREILHPKRPDTVLRDLGLEKPYFQVFARKHGFVSNLSIMDLLFNEGPDSILYLKRL